MSRHDHPVRGPQAQSYTHCGDIHQLLDHLGVGAVEGQPVHLHAHNPRHSTPDLVPHQDAQHLLFLEKNEGRDRSGGGRGRKKKETQTFTRGGRALDLVWSLFEK